MNQQSGPQDPLVRSYLTLRKAVGIIGCALPIVLVFGLMFLKGLGIQHSISAYYHTDMRNVFVGSLCAIGIFLMSCRGYDWKDGVAGIFACVCAIGVALFPMAPEVSSTPVKEHIGWAHWTFAALLFATLAIFCIFLFTKTGPENRPTRKKVQRNRVYYVCGGAIVVSIVLIPLVTKTSLKDVIQCPTAVFWLESLAVEAFGFAWLIKGETFLKDEEAPTQTLDA
jgi:hypothetical protein